MLRHPVDRVWSEFRHVSSKKENGKAWDYHYPKPSKKGEKRTVEGYLNCENCSPGSSNRQTKMIAGVGEAGYWENTYHKNETFLLETAMEHLKKFSVVGIFDR